MMEYSMSNSTFLRVPGLYRLWDLQFLINRTDDYQIHYIELTEGGTPLFALYRRNLAGDQPAAATSPEVANGL